MTYAFVVGTRPEAIKLAPLIDILGDAATVIHTGQHYSMGMTGTIRNDLQIARATLKSRGHQLGHLTTELDRIFRAHTPRAVVVQGDTTSALAGALAANATGTPLVHVEAGLRSFDRTMPEEHNRVLIDHLADLCCAPTVQAANNLLAEQISPGRIQVTGNTIIEAAERALPEPEEQGQLLDQLGILDQPFILATIHRPENVDDPSRLTKLLAELAALDAPVILPLHPRTRHAITQYGLTKVADRLRLTEPVDYPDVLTLLRHAAIVITDSGGIQEEATVFKRPVIITRRSNERPEVEAGFGVRLGSQECLRSLVRDWLASLEDVHATLASLPSPYGDGSASRRIATALKA
ncbi:MAG: UDP-N-acetylglucosamine 2-epimerase (non-hydrolyzing), partial [Actinophytocola sp.]|nr:UDP-N-acetylglucosamine 2-epimerase (non-hydrolyzing) [Actinophytocola sp.]